MTSGLVEDDGPFELSKVLPTLARSRRVKARLTRHFGPAKAKRVIDMMRKGKLTGALGIDVHDYLVDEIGNESRTVWNGLIPATHDTYPVDVNEYAGVFYVWAMEYDDVGYFLSLDAAKGYVYGNWEGVEPAEP